MNSGVSSELTADGRFGCSYRFTPAATAPDNPIAIPQINTAPTTFADMISIKNTQTVTIEPLYNDTDAEGNIDLGSLVICTPPLHGTAQAVNDGSIAFTPDENYAGIDSLIYTVADEGGLVSDSTVVIINIFNPFTGHVGTANCDAIPTESNLFVEWANNIEITRGYINISNPDLGLVTYGEPEDAVGQAEGNSMDVVSLGDGGSIIASFEHAIRNGEGPDFAVFENSFNNTFLELAFVEVSSDGENYFRFPAISLTPTYEQVGQVDAVWAEDLYNLAGKFTQGYGTPFDLEELAGIDGLDIENVTHVKVIDAIGSVNPEYATYDSYGNIVNDPWPTEAASAGFDLDGIGVIHSTGFTDNDNVDQYVTALNSSYPNPFTPGMTRGGVNISFSLAKDDNVNIKIYNIKGQLVKSVCNEKFTAGSHSVQWNAKNNQGKTASSGVYFYKMETGGHYKAVKRMMIVK
nr:MAG: hypothetical protein CSB55_00085 [Candidatus Cloacimonadota bacterium]